MEFVTIFYLVLIFISLYMLVFFMMLTIKNRKKIFYFPERKKDYSISIIIPAFNEEETIEETIEHVVNLDYPKDKLEIIAINDGSKDKTKEKIKKMMKKYSQLRLLDKPNSGKADSINKGIEIAKGELIAITDSDSFPSKDSLKKLVGFFNDEKMGAVTSFVTVRNSDKNLLTKIQEIEYLILAWSRKLLDFVDSVFVTNGPLSLYRKKYLLKVGGFDSNTLTEDIDVTWNLISHNYKTAMCLDAQVSTVVPHKFKEWYNQRVRWGVGGIQAILKYKKHFFKKGIFGLFIIPFCSLTIFLSIFVFLFSMYIFAKNFYLKFLTTSYSILNDISVFHFQNINLNPSTLFFFFAVMFVCSFIYYNYILYKINPNKKLTIRNFATRFLYSLFYLALYPIIWFPSVYRLIKKDYRWR